MSNNKNKKILNVPALRFPEFNGEWKETRYGEICSLFSGGTPPSSNKKYYNGEIPFIRSGEIHSAKTELSLTQEGIINSASKLVHKGDILLAIYGATSGDISICKIDGAINQAIICMRSEENNSFVKYSWGKNVKSVLQKYLQGGQGNLSAEIIRNIKVSIPSANEQNKVANFLSLIDERIEIQNGIIEKLQSLICGLCDYLINLKRNGSLVCFANIGEAYSGLSGKRAEDFGSGKPFLSYMNIYQNRFISYGLFEQVQIGSNEHQNRVRNGDVIFTMSSETPEEVGIGSVYIGNEEELYLNSFCFGIHLNTNKVYPPYMAYFVSSSIFRKFVFSLAQGSTRFNLQKSDFMRKPFFLPDIKYQIKIATILDSFSNQVELLKSQDILYDLQKKYLMSVLFR